MSLTSSTRLLPWGRGLIPLELPFAAKFSSFKRTLLEMDDLSRFQYAVAASVVLHAIVLFGVTFRPHDLSRLDSASLEFCGDLREHLEQGYAIGRA